MKWFRIAALVTVTLAVVIAVALASLIISMCTNQSKMKAIDSDPNYNGTLPLYIVIVLIQLFIIGTSFLAYNISYTNWKNNYQMDHAIRHKFIIWIAAWGFLCLANLGVAVFALMKGKEPQDEMTTLFEIFSKNNQDTKFVGHFERYQRENNCCGVYGPDDWLMIQLRSGLGGGGGGGGYQSLDYGFKQNPSTGHCHLTPTTVPQGCGRKILAEMHILMATFSGLMILETLVGIAACVLAGYSFFYWLEKEVIVIPEDEVSNLIIMEPESSTSTTAVPSGNPDAYLHPGSKGPSFAGSYRGNPSQRPTGNFPPGSRFNNPAGGTSRNPRGGTSRNPEAYLRNNEPGANATNPMMSDGHPAGYLSRAKEPTIRHVSKVPSKPHSKKHMLHAQEQALGGKLLGEMHVDHSKDEEPELANEDGAQGKHGKKPHHATIAIVRNTRAPKPKKLFAAEAVGSGHHGQTGHLAEDIAEMTGNQKAIKAVLDDVVLDVEHNGGIPPGGYLNSLEHKKKEEEKQTAKDESVSGEGAQNILSGFLEPVAIAHAHDKKLKDEELPLVQPHLAGGSNDNKYIHGKYLPPATGSHEQDKYMHHEKSHYLKAGSHEGGKYVHDHYLAGGSHEGGKYMHDHYLGAGSHEREEYIHHEEHGHSQYIHLGAHESAHYVHDRYLHPSHEHDHYLGEHEHDHYINRGSHEHEHYISRGSRPFEQEEAHHHNAGSHENAHYLHEEHEQAHHHNAGSHENAHYINRGEREHAHYLNARSHEHEHDHEQAHHHPGSHEHEQAHHHPGSHEHAHYLHEEHEQAHHHNAGSHEHAHYINRGEHEQVHYLNNGGSRQQHAHNPLHNGEHEQGHYLNAEPPVPEHYNQNGEHDPNYFNPGPPQQQLFAQNEPNPNYQNEASRRWNANTTILYKNPKPVDEND